MYKFDGNPWRCWERTTLPAVIHGPDKLLVRVALRDLRDETFQTEFRWPALRRVGPNDFGGRYAQITLRFGEVDWSFEACNDGDRTILLVRPMDPDRARGVQLRLETLYTERGAGHILAREEEVVATLPGHAWRVWSPSPAVHRTGSTLTAPLARPFSALIERVDARYGYRLEERDVGERRASDESAALTQRERDLAGEVARARREFMSRFAHVPAEFWWIYAAIPYGIGWNVIWAADRGEPLPVSSRDWCVHGNYGEWVLFNWDTFLLVPAAAEYDPALAHQMLRAELSTQTPEGLIPGIASPLGYSADRAMPPVASFAAWKAYQRSGDKAFVEEHYDAMMRYHEWWRRNRDGNGDGLLEWGSNPAPAAHPQWQAHSFWAARYETGMDNHPMWDEARYNPATNTQEQYDVGLSALHGLDARCLAEMAALLGRSPEADRFRARAADMARRIEAHLWNDDVGLWLSRDWRGPWCERAAPTCFYPMFLPVDGGRAERAIRDHLLDPRRFGGKYVLCVSPKDDPAYAEQYYVRGRIWPPQTLLTAAALREAGREDALQQLARGCIETMRQEWLDEGHLHETYNAETADGDDTAESDPLYSFGMLLPMVAWWHLRDNRIDGEEVSHDLSVFAEQLDQDGSLRKRVEPIESLAEL